MNKPRLVWSPHAACWLCRLPGTWCTGRGRTVAAAYLDWQEHSARLAALIKTLPDIRIVVPA